MSDATDPESLAGTGMFPEPVAATNGSSEGQSPAYGYINRGWAVLPCHAMVRGKCSCGKPDCGSPGKHPRTFRGVKDASTDPARVAGWIAAYQDHGLNWGIACGRESGVVVIDVDPRHNGPASLEAWEQEHGQVLSSPVAALTGGGGWHLFYEYPADVTISNRTDWLPGVDIKSDGGYVIAAPSNHVSGGKYSWKHDVDGPPTLGDVARPLSDDAKPASAPPDLTQSIAKRKRDNSSADLYARIPEGERNDTVFRRACAFVRKRGDAPEAVEGIKGILRNLVDGTFSDAELDTTVQSAVRTVRESGELPGDRFEQEVERYLREMRAKTEAKRRYGEELTQAAQSDLPGVVPRSAAELLVEDEQVEYEWVIPGRLPKGIRLILTADEGAGKSTLLRWIAGAVSAGLDPFDWVNRQQYPPQRVLFLDVENPYDLFQNRLREMIDAWEINGATRAQMLANLFFLPRSDFGQPLALEDPHYVEQVKHWVAEVKPDLLVIGPIYKLSDHNEREEPFFQSITQLVDSLRGDLELTVLMEAHTPHDADTRRPIGSSGWKRWPDMGFHLARSGRLTEWRGNRYGTEVSWPSSLRRAADGNAAFDLSVTLTPGTDLGDAARDHDDKDRALLARLVDVLSEVENDGARSFVRLKGALRVGEAAFKAALDLGVEEGVLEVRSVGPRGAKHVFTCSEASEQVNAPSCSDESRTGEDDW